MSPRIRPEERGANQIPWPPETTLLYLVRITKTARRKRLWTERSGRSIMWGESKRAVLGYVKEDRDTLQNYNTNLHGCPEENSFSHDSIHHSTPLSTDASLYQSLLPKPTAMDIYSHKFRKNSFILKPPNLRGEETFPVSQVLLGPILKQRGQKNPILAQCSTEVKPPVPTMDYSQQPTFKRENSDLGVCFISEKKWSPFVPMPVKMN